MKLGLNEIDSESYHADREYVSSSGLKLLLKDPRTFYKKYVKEEKDNGPKADHLGFGSYVHTLVLEPHLVDVEYAIYDGVKRGKKWEEFKAEHENKIIISPRQRQDAFYVVEEIKKNKFATELLQNGTPEQTLCVELEGVKVKVRADFINGAPSIVDVKTANSALDLDSLDGIFSHWHYRLSAALYTDAFTQFTGKKHDFYYIFSSTKYASCRVVKASEKHLEIGRKQYKKALELLKTCKRTGIWYNDTVEVVD